MQDAYSEFAERLAWPDFRRLFDYWRSKCTAGNLPARREIDPIEFLPLLPRIFLVDVTRSETPPRLRFRYRLAGTEHQAINSREITGLEIEEAFAPEHVETIRAAYSAVADRGVPHVARSFAAIEGRQHVKYDRLLLPLASDGRTVDMMLGYLQPVTSE